MALYSSNYTPNASGTTWADQYNLGSGTAQNVGFGTATSALNAMGNQSNAYPADYTGSLQGPAQQTMGQYYAAPGYQNVAAPTYSGLLGGDYAALQSAMEAPVYQAYDRTLADINNAAAGSGMYGSTGQGLQSSQIGQAGQDVLLSGLSQATQARIAAQQSDLANQNLFNTNMFSAQTDQNKTAAVLGLAESQRLQDYSQNTASTNYANQQAQADFANSKLREQFGYNTQKDAYDRGLLQDYYQNSLALAGQATPAVGAQLSYQSAMNSAAQQATAAQQAASAQNTAGWLGAAGSIGGGLLGSDGFWGLFS